MLDKLANNNINDSLRTEFANFLEYYDAIAKLLRQMVNKDLKLGCNANTINKVWDGLIPTSETGIEIKPMLASKFDFDKPPKGEFEITEKLDGIRCLAIVENGNVTLYTRQGKVIEGCLEIENDLLTMYACRGRNFVVDGELLATDCTYENVYKETTKRVKNKDEVKTGIIYKMFDMLEIEEFKSCKSSTPYRKRIGELVYSFDLCNKIVKNITVVDCLYIGKDIARVLELLEEYRLKGAEGLMVNLMDAPYEFKRSKNILKVKVMQTADLRIIGFEEGQGKNKGKLGAILVDFKGGIVKVGSGFTDFDREFIWKNQHMYINRVVEVSYFEISKDKTGKESLRFPVFKEIREFGKEVSYY